MRGLPVYMPLRLEMQYSEEPRELIDQSKDRRRMPSSFYKSEESILEEYKPVEGREMRLL